MRIIRHHGGAAPVGYVIWLSARDTYDWAHRPGSCWPDSRLSDHRLCATIDGNGLCALTIDGREPGPDEGSGGGELAAIIADHLPADLRHLWPCWEARPLPEQAGTRVGLAIARDVLAEDMPHQWTGLDPQDGDQLTAAGILPDTPEWDRAVAAARSAYAAALARAG